MKNNLKLFGIIAFIVVIGFSMINCGGSSLAGIWELYSVENGSYGDIVEKIEFFKDGTGVMGGTRVEWKTEKNRIMLSAFGQAHSENFKLSGSTLTFTSDEGLISVYKKVNNKGASKGGKNRLNGTWELLNSYNDEVDDDILLIFSGKKVTIINQDDGVEVKGTYSTQNDIVKITFTQDGRTYEEQFSLINENLMMSNRQRFRRKM